VAPDGKSSYVPRTIVSDALLRFLAEQRQQPSELTIVHFTGDFLHLALAINSSTIDGAWNDALALMGPELRQRFANAAAQHRLVDNYKLAKIRTTLSVDRIEMVDRSKTLLHVHAIVTRKKASLLAESGPTDEDRLDVELVERIVPRTIARPDGLEIIEMRIGQIAAPNGAATPVGARREP